jgi:hypothetical protein
VIGSTVNLDEKFFEGDDFSDTYYDLKVLTEIKKN